MIKKALLGKRISEASDRDIRTKLSVIYSMIGLRPQHFPTEAEDKFLFGYMRMHYGFKTLDELVLAFDMAIQGEYNLDVKEVQVFDQFTCEYLARIMTEYRKWLKDKNKKVETASPPVTAELPEAKVTRDEMIAEIEELKKREDLKIEFIPPYIYNYLEELGEIDLTDEDKWELVEQAADLRKTVLSTEADRALQSKQRAPVEEYNNFIEQLKSGVRNIKGPEVNRLRELSKKIAVFQYIISNKL